MRDCDFPQTVRTALAVCILLFGSLRVGASEVSDCVSGGMARVPSEQWEQAARLVRVNADWARWLSRVRQATDRWLAQDRESADYVAGVIHDYVDTVTQVPLSWTPESPIPETKGLARDAWVAYMRLNNVQRIRDAARLYKLTGDDVYLRWAARQLDFYSNYYSRWPLRTKWGYSRMMVQPLDEAMAAMHLVDSVRLLKGAVSTDRQLQWKNALLVPLAENLKRSDLGVSNVSLWIASALTAIGYEIGEPSYVKDGLWGPRGVYSLLRSGLGEDGLWLEGSFGYNTYVLRALVPMFITATIHGHCIDVAAAARSVRRMLITPYQLVFEDGTLPNPSDSTLRFKPDDPYIHLEFYRVLASEDGISAARRIRSWDTLIDPVSNTENTPPDGDKVVASRLFPAAKMAVLKKDGWQVFFRYGQATYKHAQIEALNTEIYHGSHRIVTDPGAVSYGSIYQQEYFSRAAAHNIPVVDGQGQSRWLPGKVLDFDAQKDVVSVAHEDYQLGVSAEKTLMINGGRFIERTSLSAREPLERRLGFIFNTDCLVFPSGGMQAHPAPAGDGFQFWTQVTRNESVNDKWNVKLVCSGVEVNASFSLPGRFSVYSAKAPNTPLPTMRNVLYFEQMARRAVLEMTLSR